ncbi:hypothetical protein VTO42DRAFT_548 [Malbranchea cinnamomea]
MAAEYSKRTNADLIEMLKARSLPHTGKKAELVARLVEADKAAAAEAEKKSKAATPTGNDSKVDTAADDVIDWDDDGSPGPGAETTNATTDKVSEATAGGTGAVANPTVVPNQQIDTDPSTTHDLKVVKPSDEENKAKTKTTESGESTRKSEVENGTTAKSAEESSATEGQAKAASADFSIGLAATDLDAELAKRKARAEKFGIVDDPSAREAQKAIERAKRFGIQPVDARGIKGLDEALPSERPRKRGWNGGDNGGDRGKRRDFHGRGGQRFGGNGGRRQSRNGNNSQARNGTGGQQSKWSEADLAAMERRKQRFG